MKVTRLVPDKREYHYGNLHIYAFLNKEKKTVSVSVFYAAEGVSLINHAPITEEQWADDDLYIIPLVLLTLQPHLMNYADGKKDREEHIYMLYLRAVSALLDVYPQIAKNSKWSKKL